MTERLLDKVLTWYLSCPTAECRANVLQWLTVEFARANALKTRGTWEAALLAERKEHEKTVKRLR